MLDESIAVENKIFGIETTESKQFQPQVYSQYSQSHSYLSQSDWQLMQQNLIFYQHLNQYAQNHQSLFMADQTYQNYNEPSHQNYVEQSYHYDTDQSFSQ